MAIFIYMIKTHRGVSSARITAPSKAAAKETLARQGLQVLKITEQGEDD